MELLFQQHLPTWYQHEALERRGAYFGVKNSPSTSVALATATNVGSASIDLGSGNSSASGGNPTANAFMGPGNGGGGNDSGSGVSDVPIYPSSHPRQGFLFGPTLPRVAEFAGPSGGVGVGVGLRRTDASPSPPASPINLSSRNAEGDCFEPDWFPYQSEGVASSPAPIFSFGGELTPRVGLLLVYYRFILPNIDLLQFSLMAI